MKPRQDSEEDNERGLTIVNVVVGRDAAPRSKSAYKKDAKILAVSLSTPTPPSRRVPAISFGSEDQWFHDVLENPPMVITARVGTGLVRRILIDNGADSNIMFRNVFDALGLRETDLKTHQHGLHRRRSRKEVVNGGVRCPKSLHDLQPYPGKENNQRVRSGNMYQATDDEVCG